MPLPLLVPLPRLSLSGFYPEYAVLKRLLNEVLLLKPPLEINEKWNEESDNALLKFKSLYFSKYKQNLPSYGLITEELFVALGKELKEMSETKFQKLIKDLNDPQWTLILTGKIYEVRAIGKKVDLALAELFTKNGIVEGASQPLAVIKRVGLGLKDNHFYLKDGQLHTIHIYNDSTASKSTGVYIPNEFSLIEYLGGRMANVTATNPATKQIIRASHILIDSEIQFDTKKKTSSELAKDKIKIEDRLRKNKQIINAKGSRYIGDTGGPQGNTTSYLHAHLAILKDAKSMSAALEKKYKNNQLGEDQDSSSKQYLGDFRNLVKIA